MNKLSQGSLRLCCIRTLCLKVNQMQQPLCQIHAVAKLTATHFDTFASNRLLNDLGKSGRVDEARHLFDKMSDKDEFTWNTMISAYARSDLLIEAKQLLSETPHPSSVAWSSLISGYSHQGCGTEAFRLFWLMQLEGLRPNQYTLGSALRACSISALLQRGQQIHAHAIKTQFDLNLFVVTGLVDMYAKCKQISEAEYLFHMILDNNNLVLWNTMITGYSQNGYGLQAMECFRDMKSEGIGMNQFTFPSILTACAANSAFRFGMQVHCSIIRSGFEFNAFVESSLVDMYAKCWDVNSAERVLEYMKVDDVVSWNSLIMGCVRKGCNEEALSLFKKMHQRQMKIDHFTYPSVLNALASIFYLETAGSVHCLTIKTGFGNYKLVGNALVDMYAKCGSLYCASRVFLSMGDRDVVSWTSLISGHARHGFYEEALKLYYEMRGTEIEPDLFVIASVFSACAELTCLEFGKQVHGNLVRSGLGSSLSVGNSLVTMYAKCGCLDDANLVFGMMHLKDVVSWTALIVGFAQNGRGKDSLQLYNQMILSGSKPDYVTFVGLLFACSHAGLVDEGFLYFESMEMVHGIKRGREHYACMIDLLGRSGKIDKAVELLNQMPFQPDATVWKALLAACRSHGKLEVAVWAAESLFELEPKNAVAYVQLANMYSASGRWVDAGRIRSLMKSRGVKKEPGCSWMEVNGRVHVFMIEDRNHPRKADIYLKLEEMMILIKEAGYVPDMNFALHDMDEDGKELGLSYHSEKLAVAFGLLSIPPGAPIRIYKNLRVCGDCHNAMKFISEVFQRRVILRDANCFHHFSEGKCSCKDYW
ncbi:putative pentatricopeptide repeat-containing protein At5g52630 [Papaver somniferum]|nr:putative pentatricopeptide repeat-containing protein At5g52630 [Papaver somniferum]